MTSKLSQAEMGILEHLGELRKRLLYSCIAIFAGSIVAYFFSEQTFAFISAPYTNAFPNQMLVGTGPAEAFVIKIKVAVYAGMMLALPVVLFQVWSFVAPGLYEKERKLVVPFVAGGSFLFFLGTWFCYTQVLPRAFAFFNGEYQSIHLDPMVHVESAIATVLTMMLAFGVMFQLPLLTFILARMGVVTHTQLLGFSRYAIVLIFIIAALFSPDVVSQLLMSGPLIVLYYIGVLLAKVAASPGGAAAPQADVSSGAGDKSP